MTLLIQNEFVSWHYVCTLFLQRTEQVLIELDNSAIEKYVIIIIIYCKYAIILYTNHFSCLEPHNIT